MRIYKTRKDFTALNAAGNPGVFKGTVCTITDEAANPMYAFQNNTWTGVGLQTGYRTVLFGDSMTDQIDTPVAPTSATYNASTGDLTIASTAHQQAVGWQVDYWNRNYAALTSFGTYTITSTADANTFVINIGANLSGVPNGVLTASSTFYRAKSWKSAECFVNWLLMHSGQTFNIIYNGGQSGDQTSHCLTRLQAYCLSKNPDVVICQLPGINDINQNVPTETIWTNLKSLIDQLCNQVRLNIFLTITPVLTGESRATLSNMTRVMKLNRRIKNYLLGKRNAVLFDAHKMVVNPSDANGFGLSTFLRTADKIHWSLNGGQRVGQALWNQVSKLFSTDFSTLPSSHADSWITGAVAISSASSDGAANSIITLNSTAHGLLVGETIKLGGGTPALNAIVTVATTPTANQFTVVYPGLIAAGAITGTIYVGPSNNLFDNPVFATATGGTLAGGATGVAANHVKVNINAGSPTAVASVPARTDGIGNDQQVVITAAAAGNQVLVEADFALATTLYPTVVAAGRTYVFEGLLSLSGVSGSNLSELRANISAIVGGVTYQTYATNGYASGTALTQDLTDIHFRTAPFLLPAGAVTNFKWQCAFLFSALGTALTVKLGRVNLLELDVA